jgi:hypothetical protein
MSLQPIEGSRQYFEIRDKIAAERERQFYAARAKIARMRGTLIAASTKLCLYRAQHSGEYVGGVEFHELMRQISEVLDETKE